MIEETLTITHKSGLHARPLSKFVKTARGFDAEVKVWNLTREQGPASGISPLKLMMLAISDGHEIKISAEGNQAAEVMTALTDLISNNFGEGIEA